VRGWNLSYESLTSFEVHEKLQNLKADNPGFWSKLSMEKEDTTLPAADDNVPEDAVDVEEEDSYGDDSSIPLSAIVDTVISEKGDSGLVSQDLARDDNEAPADEIDGQDDNDLGVHTTVSKEASNSSSVEHATSMAGRGTRKEDENL
jgi:hypothetical protein